MGVTEGEQSCLHQLREENILSDQNKLRMLISSIKSVCLSPLIRLLHNTEDGDRQTCGGVQKGKEENKKDCLSIWL